MSATVSPVIYGWSEVRDETTIFKIAIARGCHTADVGTNSSSGGDFAPIFKEIR